MVSFLSAFMTRQNFSSWQGLSDVTFAIQIWLVEFDLYHLLEDKFLLFELIDDITALVTRQYLYQFILILFFYDKVIQISFL